jgi:hypothetical protein
MIDSWDTKTHPEVTCAFLMLASPDTVHEHLREYGAFLDDDILATSRSDEKLETALLSRNEPLINLALARFGADAFVLAQLYRRHFMGETAYDRSIRLACLANHAVVHWLSNFADGQPVSAESGPSYPPQPEEIQRLIALDAKAREKNEWGAYRGHELSALLLNPRCYYILRDLYLGAGYFAGMGDAHRAKLVQLSADNPFILDPASIRSNRRVSTGDIEDSIFLAVLHLFQHSPTTREWAVAIRSLLHTVDPSLLPLADTNRATRYAEVLGEESARQLTSDPDPRESLLRWRDVVIISEYRSDEGKLEKGWLTELSFVDELRCLMAAFIGRRYGEKWSTQHVGTPDEEDLALRCAYYGNAKLTPVEMEAAHDRDRDGYLLAALHNHQLYRSRASRAVLEQEASSSPNVKFIYEETCRRIAKHNREFNPEPLLDQLGEDPEEKRQPLPPTTEELLEPRFSALDAKLKSIQTIGFWAAIILSGLVLLKGHRSGSAK